MDPISLILLSLQGLSVVLKNPALGGGSQIQLGHAADILLSLAGVIAQGEAGYEHLKQFTATIESMAAEGRAPTRAEWADLIARRDAAHERLQAVKVALAGQSPAPPSQPVGLIDEADAAPQE